MSGLLPDLRRRVLRAHRWTGLGAGLAFIAVAVTGAGLVFREQLEPHLAAALLTAPTCASPQSLDAIVLSARAANPGSGALKAVRLYPARQATVRVRFSDGRWIYVDPCSARVTGQKALYGGPFGLLTRIHIFEYTGAPDPVSGSVALLFAVVTLGGGFAAWRLATVRRGVHQRVAMYAAPILLVIAVTGMTQAFHWGQAAPAPAITAAGTPLPLQDLLARAQALIPQAQKIQIRFPAAAQGPAVFDMVAQDAPHANALSYVQLDQGSGALLRHVTHTDNTAAHKLSLLAAGVHYGWVGGMPAQLLLLAGALSVPLLAWTGTAGWLRTRRGRRQHQRMTLVVTRKLREADAVCSFQLARRDGRQLPPFGAGAHLDVFIRPGLVRQYSLCGDPAERRRYQIAVLRTAGSRGGSRALHDDVLEGSMLTVGVPRNHFPLTPRARHSLLVAGGIGITPLLAMAEKLSREGADFDLHYCARTPAHAAFRERIARSRYAHRVTFHYSAAPGHRRIDLAALLDAAADGVHLYVCGPDGFTDAVLSTAREQGWSDSQLHREYFAGAARASAGDKAFSLRIASSGQLVHVAAGVSALDALASAGIAVPSACLSGVCGTCLTGVLDGEPEHRDRLLTTAEKARNSCFTPCCSRARSGVLTLDL